MPLLRRLFWPLLTLPTVFAALLFLLTGTGGAWRLHALAVALAPATFALLYWGLRRSYLRWSQPPAASSDWGPDAVLAAPERVVLISRGGYLTPATAAVTERELKVFAGGRFLLSIPLERVAGARLFRGRWLRTPYVDLTAGDGRRLARIGVESAEAWVQALSSAIARRSVS